ncbi:hypothetical protein SOVF_214280 [Spinacia oleracea]|nr:hypothetical protein SOVF_214280 [Spinacia oleracea]
MIRSKGVVPILLSHTAITILLASHSLSFIPNLAAIASVSSTLQQALYLLTPTATTSPNYSPKSHHNCCIAGACQQDLEPPTCSFGFLNTAQAYSL